MSEEILQIMKDILNIPSPTGYNIEILRYLKNILDENGMEYTEINKGGIVVTLKGEDSKNAKLVSAHLDTLGGMVKEIKSNGRISISKIGGYMMNTYEGENCVVIKNDGIKLSGTLQTMKPSVHIDGDEAHKLKRDTDTMEIILDEKIDSKEDASLFGINIGDFVAFDPRTKITKSGFIKSRYLDDKACAAILIYLMIKLKNSKLKRDVHFMFSVFEECGHGARAGIPENTKEFVAVDMGAAGNNQNSTEYDVSICAKDSSGPYSIDLKNKFMEICEKHDIKYKIDIYPYYGSDASAAISAGYDILTGLIGPGIFASHGYERTHMESILNTTRLIEEYILE